MRSTSEHAYGAQGSFSFPSVPGGSDVEFLLELVEWEPPFGEDEKATAAEGEGEKEKKEAEEEGMRVSGGKGAEEEGAAGEGVAARSEERRERGTSSSASKDVKNASSTATNPRTMLFEDRLEASERRRLEGNSRLAAGAPRQALGSYLAAASFVDEDLLLQLVGRHEEAAREARRAALCNAALAALRLADPRQAEQLATQALEATEEGKDAKAFARRAAARRELGDLRGATDDLRAALELAPDDARLRAAKRDVAREERKQRKEGAGVFKGIFG